MRILVGITGSIASYRSPDFVKDLVKLGHEVQVVLSSRAPEFVSQKVLETLSNRTVMTADAFSNEKSGTDHIALARWAEVFFIYGASADALARFAQGSASDFMSLQLLAFKGPVLVAPAMNPAMWEHPAVRRNVTLIEGYGYKMVGPIAGVVTCGEEGIGHIAEHSAMFAAIAQAGANTQSATTAVVDQKTTLAPKMAGTQINPTPARPSHKVAQPSHKILISAGAMRSPVDPMRFVQNRSSGETALEVARAFKARGDEVTVLLGPVEPRFEKEFLANFSCRRFLTAEEYGQGLDALFPVCELFISLAAVLDFSVVARQDKMSRESLQGQIVLPIQSVPDFVKNFNARKTPQQKVVAFAAETGTESEILARARKKLQNKGCDLIVANPLWGDMGAEKERTQFWVIGPDENNSVKHLGPSKKDFLARELVEEISRQLA